MAALYTSPGTARVNFTHQSMRFLGSGTAWLTSTPTFTPSGLAGVTLNSQTVVSDTEVVANVTYPNTAGTVTWTDSTTGQTVQQAVKLLNFAKKCFWK